MMGVQLHNPGSTNDLELNKKLPSARIMTEFPV
jgi:hypothetical protein